MLDSLAFDPFALFDDACGPAEVGIGWRYVVETLVIAPVVGRLRLDPVIQRLPVRREAGKE